MDQDMMDEMRNMMGDVDFPATKQDIMDQMMDKGASDDMMDMVRKLPDKEYGSMSDVMDAMGGMGGM